MHNIIWCNNIGLSSLSLTDPLSLLSNLREFPYSHGSSSAPLVGLLKIVAHRRTIEMTVIVEETLVGIIVGGPVLEVLRWTLGIKEAMMRLSWYLGTLPNLILKWVHHGALCKQELKDENVYLPCQEKRIIFIHAFLKFIQGVTWEVECEKYPETQWDHYKATQDVQSCLVLVKVVSKIFLKYNIQCDEDSEVDHKENAEKRADEDTSMVNQRHKLIFVCNIN